MPQDIKRFCQSLVAVSLFASNILFWRTSDYFETATELKPLLHTWSLSVEEQYYLLFPLFLLFAWRFGKKSIGTSIVVVAIVSLLFSQYLSSTEPMSAFYLLPTRAWELMMGALVAFYYTDHNIKRHKSVHSQIGSLFGFILICFSILFYNSGTPFPSFYTLAPTVGASLIIIFTNQNTYVGKLLSSKLFVSVGLISYSAYLWHQPLFAFARYRSLGEPTVLLMSFLALVSFPIAYLNWRFIERPFRNRHHFTRKHIFVFATLGSFIFIGIGLFGHKSDGFNSFWEKNQSESTLNARRLLDEAKTRSSVFVPSNRVDNNDCIFNVENITPQISTRVLSCNKKYGQGIAVIGDSHATNLFNSLNLRNDNRLRFFIGFTKNGCHLPTDKEDCQYGELLNFVSNYPAVFSGFIYEKAGWLMFKNSGGNISTDMLQNVRINDNFEGFQPDNDVILGVVEYLKKLANFAPVVWFGPRIEPQINIRTIYRYGCNYPFSLRNNQYLTYKNLENILEKTAFNTDGIEYISQMEAYKFQFPTDFLTCDKAYWIDGNHFSPNGEDEFSKRYDLIGHLIKKGVARQKAP